MILGFTILSFLVHIATAEEYCTSVETPSNFYTTPTTSSVISTLVNVAIPRRSDLVYKDGGSIILSKTHFHTGTYNSHFVTVSTTGFCDQVGDVLRSADINKDGKEDLFCVEATGTFSAMLYTKHSGNDGYTAPAAIAAGFKCTTKLVIGDFDGNNAVDFLCIDSTRSTIDANSKIYFSGVCGLYFHHVHDRFYRHIGHSRYDSLRDYHQPPTDLMAMCMDRYIKYMFPKSITGCDPATDHFIVGDINGDNKDDIICHHVSFGTADSVSFLISEGGTSGEIFPTVAIDAAATTCSTTNGNILMADVDNDGDDDLVCVDATTTGTVNAQIALSDAGAGTIGAFTAAAGGSCTAFCDDATDNPVDYAVGDFNADGTDDIMCRYEVAGAIKTDFVYAVV